MLNEAIDVLRPERSKPHGPVSESPLQELPDEEDAALFNSVTCALLSLSSAGKIDWSSEGCCPGYNVRS